MQTLIFNLNVRELAKKIIIIVIISKIRKEIKKKMRKSRLKLQKKKKKRVGKKHLLLTDEIAVWVEVRSFC